KIWPTASPSMKAVTTPARAVESGTRPNSDRIDPKAGRIMSIPSAGKAIDMARSAVNSTRPRRRGSDWVGTRRGYDSFRLSPKGRTRSSPYRAGEDLSLLVEQSGDVLTDRQGGGGGG